MRVHEILLFFLLILGKQANSTLLSVEPRVSSFKVHLPIVLVICNNDFSQHLLQASIQLNHI